MQGLKAGIEDARDHPFAIITQARDRRKSGGKASEEQPFQAGRHQRRQRDEHGAGRDGQQEEEAEGEGRPRVGFEDVEIACVERVDQDEHREDRQEEQAGHREGRRREEGHQGEATKAAGGRTRWQHGEGRERRLSGRTGPLFAAGDASSCGEAAHRAEVRGRPDLNVVFQDAIRLHAGAGADTDQAHDEFTPFDAGVIDDQIGA